MVILIRGAGCVCPGLRRALVGPPLAGLEIFFLQNAREIKWL